MSFKFFIYRIASLEKDVKQEKNATKMAKSLNEETINELTLSEDLIESLKKQFQASKIELKEEILSKNKVEKDYSNDKRYFLEREQYLLITMESMESGKLEHEQQTEIMNKDVEELKIRVKELEATDLSE